MRHIALLEFQPGLQAVIRPPFSVLEKTNGSLPAADTHLMVDEQGFMVSARPLAEGDRKVLLLGSSPIENLYIHQDARVLAQLEGRLAAGGYPAKVYSAAISSAHLLHMWNILMNKGIALRPDVLVFYLAPGFDLLANESENTFWNRENGQATIRAPGQSTAIVWNTDHQNRNQFVDERRLLTMLYALCASFGIKLVVATWPQYGSYDEFMQKLVPERALFDSEERGTARLNALLRQINQEQGGMLIDLEAIFAPLAHGDYFYDWNHPNPQGCAVIAAATATAIGQLLAAG